jgi:tetratricopeptide (TPR) repeat protein
VRGLRLLPACDHAILTRADPPARPHDATLPDGADRSDRAQPARLRINFLMEMDKMKEAATVARAYLDRMAAWPAYPFAPDPSIDFYEPLRRADEISAKELAEHREEWIRQEKKRDKSPRNQWTIWMNVYGAFVENKEEALEALEKRPKAALPDPARRPLHMDFALGKAYVLAGRFDEGLPYLERVLHTCMTLDLPLLVLRANWYKGMALESKGDAAQAKAAYETVLKGWPESAPSRTVKQARERLSTLTRN